MAATEYYDHTTYPAIASFGNSSGLRTELDNIEAGFGKLPDLASNGGKVVAVNSGASGLEAIVTTGTGSGVRATSPTLVTPVLGVASATSINKVAITAPATSATLTLADGSTLATSGAFATTLTATAATNVTLPTTGTLATLAGTETLTNKTLTTPVLNGLPTGTGVATANTVSTLVARDASGNFSAGTITAAGRVIITADSAYASGAGVWKQANHGLTVQTATGTDNDFMLFTPGGGVIFVVPTGTRNVVFPASGGSRVVIGQADDGVNKLQVGGNAKVSGEVTATEYVKGKFLRALGLDSVGAGVTSSGVEFYGLSVAHGLMQWRPNERLFVLGTGNTADGALGAYGAANLEVTGKVTAADISINKAPVAAAGVASTHTLALNVNGTVYRFLIAT